jgi:hypothetical protein
MSSKNQFPLLFHSTINKIQRIHSFTGTTLSQLSLSLYQTVVLILEALRYSLRAEISNLSEITLWLQITMILSACLRI